MVQEASPKIQLLMKNQIVLTIIAFAGFFNFQTIQSQSCNCTEYVYLNDTAGDATHKFIVNADGTLTELLNGTTPWLTEPGFLSPHGFATDINGNVYIAERATGDIRKMSCDGVVLPESEFVINDGGTNFGSVGNYLFANSRDDRTSVQAYDTCTGAFVEDICFEGVTNNWGFHINATTEQLYFNGSGGQVGIYVATVADLGNTTCVQPLITQGTTIPNIGDNWLPPGEEGYGLTTDEFGNIYTVVSPSFGNDKAQLYKYDSSGILLATSIIDDDNETGTDGFFSSAVGIVYSSTTGMVYTSNGTESTAEDCISIFDSNLNYIGTGFPNPPSGTGQLAKGIGIVTECCPINATTTIDTLLCNRTIGEELLLQDIINCSGPVCEGAWTADNSQHTFAYNECSNTITIDNLNACGTFTLNSGGGGAFAQCSPFTMTVNICTSSPSDPVISITDNICIPSTPGSINVDTPCSMGSILEYSTDGGLNWSTVPPTYDNSNPITVRARCIDSINGECTSAETADITSVPQECCPVDNCAGITVTPN